MLILYSHLSVTHATNLPRYPACFREGTDFQWYCQQTWYTRVKPECDFVPQTKFRWAEWSTKFTLKVEERFIFLLDVNVIAMTATFLTKMGKPT